MNFPVDTRDVSPFVPRRILQLGRDDFLHPFSDLTKLAISATIVVAKLVAVSNLHICRRGTTHTTRRYACTLPPAIEA